MESRAGGGWRGGGPSPPPASAPRGDSGSTSAVVLVLSLCFLFTTLQSLFLLKSHESYLRWEVEE